MDSSKTKHIILLPFLAQGHLRPFLHLANFLRSHTPFTLSILTTPLNAANLRRQSNNINIYDLPFNSTDHNLPPNTENTEKLPLTSIISLFYASTSLQPHVRNHLTRHHLDNPPICIIFDIFLGWADNLARSIGSTGVCFNTGGAYGLAAYMSIWMHLPHRNVPDNVEFSLPEFPENRKFKRNQLHRFLRFADGTDDWSGFFQPQIKYSRNCSAWLCNSIEEIEPLGFEVLRAMLKVPVWGIGPLVKTENSCDEDDEQGCVEWLNQFEKGSVLYISFGSQNTVTPIQMMELAKGLEESGAKFLWVIRPPFGFDINGEFKPEWLPEGFEKRVMERKQGKLVKKWGPQMEILRNKATGAFLSHCGWNSLIEALSEGVPIIGWPLAAEQAYNSKMLVEEMGVAVELTRGLEGELSSEGVKKVVEMVMDREEGSFGCEMKKAAVVIGQKLRDAMKVEGDYRGCSLRSLDEFVEFIVSRKATLS
ncbi:UDP-glycosyltransferase 92A1 [Amaranthus tricolor]|uniref:Glycosyltransferase n=4 Tax=Caryophyllales TaxID=3524 RepID=A0A7M4BIF4_AMATR|nr:UDP-glycosyltransferase 92A1 [Amaranthus tricolor]QOP57917.1 DOPA5GT [Amaranthus tricolor]